MTTPIVKQTQINDNQIIIQQWQERIEKTADAILSLSAYLQMCLENPPTPPRLKNHWMTIVDELAAANLLDWLDGSPMDTTVPGGPSLDDLVIALGVQQ